MFTGLSYLSNVNFNVNFFSLLYMRFTFLCSSRLPHLLHLSFPTLLAQQQLLLLQLLTWPLQHLARKLVSKSQFQIRTRPQHTTAVPRHLNHSNLGPCLQNQSSLVPCLPSHIPSTPRKDHVSTTRIVLQLHNTLMRILDNIIITQNHFPTIKTLLLYDFQTWGLQT